MPTNPLHLVINGCCTWCKGPHDPGPLTMTIEDIHQTRHTQPSQHMHWPVDEDTRRRLAAIITSDIRQQPEKSPAPPSRWLRW